MAANIAIMKGCTGFYDQIMATMLYNVSYNRPKIKRAIEQEVGKMLSLRRRWTLRGSGSPRLKITAKSIQIHNLMVLDSNADTCNIELRKLGIIIRFRSLLETYALPIPYYQLAVFKGSADEYSLHRGGYYVRIKADEKRIHRFMKKLIDEKDRQGGTRVEDL